MVTHFQIAPYEFHLATRQARDHGISANYLDHLTFLQGAGEQQCTTSFKNSYYMVQVQSRRLHTSTLWVKPCISCQLAIYK
jgi:hypothetical protein